MGRYRIAFARRAEKALEKLPREAQARIARRIDALAEEPRPRDAKKLQGEDDLYRVRVGDYRIIYCIRERELLVLVVGVGDRRDIYRRGWSGGEGGVRDAARRGPAGTGRRPRRRVPGGREARSRP